MGAYFGNLFFAVAGVMGVVSKIVLNSFEISFNLFKIIGTYQYFF